MSLPESRIATAVAGDEDVLDALVRCAPESTMMLRSNLRNEGLRNMFLAAPTRATFTLTQNGTPVASAAIDARLPDMVGVSGVWGVERAVLCTDAENHAWHAYEAIGFRVVGDFGLVLWE